MFSHPEAVIFMLCSSGYLYSVYYCVDKYLQVPEFIDPRFRENKPKTLVFSHRKRAFWASFRENCVYNFGHWSIHHQHKVSSGRLMATGYTYFKKRKIRDLEVNVKEGGPYYMAWDHWLINYKDNKKFTCKGTLRKVFVCMRPHALSTYIKDNFRIIL